MSDLGFEIEVMSQGWLDDDEESGRWDYCSHGEIRLVIGGEVISAGDDERDYFTISTSALSLLRTLESDHAPALPLEGSSGRHEWLNELGVPLTEKLIIHCGELAMLSCPIGIDWRVTHRDDSMQISDVVRVDNRVTTPLLDLAVELPFEKYRRQIVAFAEKAKEPFVGVEKEFDEDDYDRELYPKFWAEYDGLLARHSRG